ncbi:MAG: hypothetical protein ABI599_06610 [Flavobacteriales bacterium]
MADFVTVAIFVNPHEMAVYRARLEWEGIECFAKDENIVSANPFYSNAVGGIKLQVPLADLQRARELLVEAGALQEIAEEPVRSADILKPLISGPLLPQFPMITLERVRLLALIVIGVAAVALVLLM